MDKKVSVFYNDNLLGREEDWKLSEFERFIRDIVRVNISTSECKRDANETKDERNDHMLVEDEPDDDDMRAIEASVIHAGRPLDIDNSKI